MKDVAGDLVTKSIGTLTAIEVSETKSLCKVNSGEADIYTSVNSGVEICIKTREKRGFLKGVGDVMSNVYGGGLIADPGVQVQNPAVHSVSETACLDNVRTIPTGSKENQTGLLHYYDFISESNGRRYIEPILDWSSNKANIIAYMKDTDYVQSDEGMLLFTRDEDPHSPSIMYMILNGQYLNATSILVHVKKDSVLKWLKLHYIYKGSENKGFTDLHSFMSKDKKTSIMVSFMNINESEFSRVSIIYQKKI